MMDLTKYTVKEFAKVVGEDTATIQDLMRNNNHLGYTNKPYYNTVVAVQNSAVKESNKEIVAKFIYTNLFNRPEHRFYDTKGYSVTLR
jgi:hypothetical protein